MTEHELHDRLLFAVHKLRGVGFLIRHLNTDACIGADEANGIGTILEELADEIEEAVQ